MEVVALIAICSILMLVGFIGIFLPVIPSMPLAWLGLTIYAAGTGFDRISLTTIIVFAVLSLLAWAVDFIAPMLGAKKHKASKLGVLGALLGLVIGIFTLGFWGIIIGPFLGALIGEIIANKPTKQALGSAFGAFLGLMVGALFKITLVLVMAGFFVVSLF